MPDSPKKEADGVLKLVVKSGGSEVDEKKCRVISAVVDKKINRIPWAQLVLIDGDMSDKTFEVSSDKAFKPGAEITLEVGYGKVAVPVFKGVVITHGINIHDGGSHLVVECRDKAVALCSVRKNTNHTDSADSAILSKLIKACPGLSADVASTRPTHARMVQYQATDWDFMLTRADANGLLVTVADGKVSVKPPKTDGAAVLKVTWGDDLIHFRADMDARHQVAASRGVSWDPKTLAIAEKTGSKPSLQAQGNITTAELAKVVADPKGVLRSAVPMEGDALKAWADARLLKSGLARIRGTMRFQGSAKVSPGDLVEVEGVGDRFNGKVFVATVHHDISMGDWYTDVEFGLSPDWFAERDDISPPKASGQLPGVDGLQVGLVTKLDADPAKETRIQVSLPVMENSTPGIWARMATLYGTKDAGTFFIPEVGDEVVLGFFNSDPRHPVILGSLQGSCHKMPVQPEAKNNTKAIVTREKMKITFDEEKKVITVETPGGNKVILSDDAKGITLQDQNKNTLILNDKGISLDSPKDITVTAKGKISLDAMGAASVTSKADVKLKGMNVNAAADVGLVAKGNASAELSASGQTTVKGAMVMIN
ncbi:type VI secretion system tip protein VgrG [Desulfoluna spongiiphila]|uniref:Rhs element Vgr protein n=1 Tax=Desulfoluna spongiiphila TaxID=419481 RepID=A0A1G5DKW4_9BACT|nr:type VI secretion system tip protein VgrG [Desulfoluna spongiiphila]SCY15274.1 Rhs element Vgr protein [Desulfoluna spongiiphila]VVS95078.1 type vi secretion system rhsge-associated vgr protein [Desulfoluna spongiiphila]